MSLSKVPLNKITSLSSGDPVSDRAKKLKESWNDFQMWLQKRGLAGHPSLDKGVGDGNTGIQYVKQFQKENPTTLISPETISEVQKHFQNYREYTLNKLRTGQAMLTDSQNPKGRYVKPDENLDFYMKDLSKVDGVPGSLTSQHRFPSDFLNTIYKAPNGKVEQIVKENKGLSQ